MRKLVGFLRLLLFFINVLINFFSTSFVVNKDIIRAREQNVPEIGSRNVQAIIVNEEQKTTNET